MSLQGLGAVAGALPPRRLLWPGVGVGYNGGPVPSALSHLSFHPDEPPGRGSVLGGESISRKVATLPRAQGQYSLGYWKVSMKGYVAPANTAVTCPVAVKTLQPTCLLRSLSGTMPSIRCYVAMWLGVIRSCSWAPSPW